jgi:hypothetical protein
MTTMAALTKVSLPSWNLCYEVIMSLIKLFLCPLMLFEVTRDAVINYILSEVHIDPLQTLPTLFQGHFLPFAIFNDLADI